MKLIEHKYDNRVTKITLADKYGRYTGFSFVHPDDADFASEFAGGRLAEYRARIKALKAELRRNKTMLSAINILNKDIKNNVSEPIDPVIQKRINIQIRNYHNEIKRIEESIKEFSNTIKWSIKIRNEIIARSKEDKKN